MQVWHEDTMDEPFYERCGPDYIQVRKDVRAEALIGMMFKWPANIDLFDQILNEIIPETRNNFGSHRGYVLSGQRVNLAIDVLKKYNAYITIENNLLPYIKYKLYNPDDGLIMKKAMERFNNNKKKKFKNKKSNK
tara:strand:- start:4029 stop:4433 length:405 start_codon:yes stop_codon:yes gene_type:complete